MISCDVIDVIDFIASYLVVVSWLVSIDWFDITGDVIASH